MNKYHLFNIIPLRGRWWGAVLLLFSIACMAQTTPEGLSVLQLRNAVYVPAQTLDQGSDAALELCLKSEFAASAYQFDMILPEGITYPSASGNVNVTPSEGSDADRVILQRRIGSNTLRIVSYSPYNKPIALSQGGSPILTIPVSVTNSLPAGEYEVMLKNIVIAGTSYSLHDSLSLVSTMLTVRREGFKPNEDGSITVVTPGTLAEYIANPDMIERLTIRGGLNGTDIAFIRQLPRLRSLDIKRAWIVKGGSAYKDNLYTSNLVIGEEMFASMSRLHDLSLCDSTVSVGANVVADDANLCYVYWNSSADVPDNAMGALPTNCLLYVPETAKAAALPRIVHRQGSVWHTSRIDLIDAMPFECPEAFTAGIATYTRSFSKTTYPEKPGGWEGIVLPFDVQYYYNIGNCQLRPMDQYIPDAMPFWLATGDSNGWKYTDAMLANTPYIISMPNSPEYPSRFNITGNVIFFAYDATLKPMSGSSAVEMKNIRLFPTYAAVTASSQNYAINDEVYKGNVPGSVFAKGLRDIRPFESYVSDLTANSQRQFIRIGLGTDSDDIDAIDEITAANGRLSMENGACFTLAGQRISRPHRGITIIRTNGVTRTVINK